MGWIEDLIEATGIGYALEGKMANEFIKSKELIKEYREFCNSKENLRKVLLKTLEDLVKYIKEDIKEE